MTPLRGLSALPILLLVMFVVVQVPTRAQDAVGGLATSTTVYLPQLATPPAPNVFGIEMSRINAAKGLELLTATNTGWVRRNGLLWRTVERSQGGAYQWDAPSVLALEEDLRNAAAIGLNTVLIIRGSPAWAVSPYNADCAPINEASYDDFARFLAAVVERYSKPPFNVKYWEIGNEPDASVFQQNSVFGCWGVQRDSYYGGEAYGRMLKYVVPVMKRVNPNIKVLNGGLLLFRPYDSADPSTLPGRFFEGMLRAGAGEVIDIVSFHTYIYYGAEPRNPIGGRVDWRVDYLRDLLKVYGVGDKPLLRSETALLCPQVTAACRWAQADLLPRSYVQALRDGLIGNIWYVYDNDSFHNTAMIEPSEVFIPRPAYFAYRNVSQILVGASYKSAISGLSPDVEAYVLTKGGETIIVFWSDRAQEVQIGLSPGARDVRCIDRDGGRLPCPLVAGKVSAFAYQSPTYIIYR